jgi:hypothetical protein
MLFKSCLIASEIYYRSEGGRRTDDSSTQEGVKSKFATLNISNVAILNKPIPAMALRTIGLEFVLWFFFLQQPLYRPKRGEGRGQVGDRFIKEGSGREVWSGGLVDGLFLLGDGLE